MDKQVDKTQSLLCHALGIHVLREAQWYPHNSRPAILMEV